jgi:hypothetical protein
VGICGRSLARVALDFDAAQLSFQRRLSAILERPICSDRPKKPGIPSLFSVNSVDFV